MRKDRYIIYIAAPALLGLFSLLGWNTQRLFQFEKEQLQEKVEWYVKSAADSIQNYNGSLLSNQAKMFTDPRYSQKLDFAAGFTHNMGKLSIALYEDTTTPPANAPVKDTSQPEKDSIPVFTQYYIKTHMKYKPEAVMGVHHFDSVFRKQLQTSNTVIHFTVKEVIPFTAGSRFADWKKPSGDSIASSLFILDFTEPIMYCVHYTIPAHVVYRHMYPYLFSTALLCLLLVSGTVFFYRSYRSQQQQAKFKQSLFGNITHELKTPLTSIQLIIDGAQRQTAGDGMVSIPLRHVQFAAEELNRMKMIVDNILSFSKMGRRQFVLNCTRIDLDNVIAQAIKIMEIKAPNAQAVINYAPGNKLFIVGDDVLLINAISAILDNAIKYTQRRPVITISLSKNDERAIIAIEDNGPGIQPSYRRKIFEPFFRIPTGDVHNLNGHGLGLSFVKQVMLLHGGKVTFSSDENGTTFYLTFNLN